MVDDEENKPFWKPFAINRLAVACERSSFFDPVCKMLGYVSGFEEGIFSRFRVCHCVFLWLGEYGFIILRQPYC